jgi:hypothetical protein
MIFSMLLTKVAQFINCLQVTSCPLAVPAGAERGSTCYNIDKNDDKPLA